MNIIIVVVAFELFDPILVWICCVLKAEPGARPTNYLWLEILYALHQLYTCLNAAMLICAIK